jgi:3-oxo-5-alpha-steroid 4-dehydrogenase 1
MFAPEEIVRILVIAVFATAAIVFPVLLLVPAPYGRFARKGWGPSLPPNAAWFIMECPSLIVPAWLFLAGRAWTSPFACACLVAWMAHYAQRVLVYPFIIRSGRPMPASVALMGACFNVVNAYVNSWYVFGPERAASAGRSLLAPSFIAGAAVFIAGYGVNLHSDRVLRNLRRGGKGGYSIPEAGLHRLVASPNYLGEILEWTGWAILAATPAAWAFAAFTAANLVPRAIRNLRWYRAEFGDAYPRERKAVIPFIL